MTRDNWDAGEHHAWKHYKRTGTVIPTYQGVIAEGIATVEESQVAGQIETDEESDSTDDRYRLRV